MLEYSQSHFEVFEQNQSLLKFFEMRDAKNSEEITTGDKDVIKLNKL